MNLTERLKTVVNLISWDTVADIGCDHGKVAIKLIQEQICKKVIAADVNIGPTEACRRNVSKFGLSDKIEVRCGDGLSVLKQGEADSIVIAGMGGELISKILKDNIEIAKASKEIIMQPMTSEENLREFLAENGFLVTDERLAKEDEKIYVIIRAVNGTEKNKLFYFPKLLLMNEYSLVNEYYNKVNKRIKDKIKGAEISKNAKALKEYIKISDEVNEVYESISDM